MLLHDRYSLSHGAGARSRQNVSNEEALISLLAGSGLVLLGLRRRRSLPLALLGGALTYRGLTGHCPVYQAAGVNRHQGPNERSVVITILRPREEVYRFCSDIRNFPQFVSFLQEVRPDDLNRHRWIVQEPGGKRHEWTVEVCEQAEPHLFRWRSLEGAPVRMEGLLEFEPAPANRGTRVRATMAFRQGDRQGLLAALFKPFARHKLRHDLKQLKQLMEAGELMTVKGQPSGRLRDLSSGRGGDLPARQPAQANPSGASVGVAAGS